MSILLSLFIALLIATFAVWIALFTRNAKVSGLSEVMCSRPLPTEGNAD